MRLARSMSPRWLSNSYLFAPADGDQAFLVDAGAPVGPLQQTLDRWRCRLGGVLLTHHHPDHIAELDHWREQAPVWGPAAEADLLPPLDRALADEEELDLAGLAVRCIHTPGHTKGQMAFWVQGHGVFTGDTLFRGSVGGTRAPGHTTYEDLRHSIMERLLTLPDDAHIWPGHTDPSTVAEERASNPFVAYWSDAAPADGRACTVGEQDAELLVAATDYDGGRKCAVRYLNGGFDVVPGSRVTIGGPSHGMD